ncbi:MAG: rRNA maturation RNase YbeY [Alphaproteobacteria bacterium]|jgi:probable rRNA maturation factor|nr:rRNA maturation RNase YbeY [Alphaproteobacteria bacterium]MBT5389525.1 rRNA maturation RNase YbeY [Alphaproteobacteria bacterium]MBT5540823.1 rRNA maturation RNase YbeY [Alphaproteobacteria bacterium]MBT5654472.1 rRNA maturation RNase YbeY [Alphaproteobacteria bacterium]
MKPSLKVDILIECTDWLEVVPDLERRAEKALLHAFEVGFQKKLLQLSNLPKEMEVSVVFADDAMSQTLNKNYRKIDQSTNVLAFPALDEKIGQISLLGDIVIAYETTIEEAKENKISVQNHMVHLVVHGILHLLGYDHGSDKEAVTMEALERKVLEHFSIPSPYTEIGDISE